MLATPDVNNGYLPGICSIPSNTVGSVSVPLLQTSDLDFVPTLLSLLAPAVDFTKAQLVVKVVDVNGNGVANVQAQGMGVAMAYASGSTWVNASTITATDSSGRVMAINLTEPAACWVLHGHES